MAAFRTPADPVDEAMMMIAELSRAISAAVEGNLDDARAIVRGLAGQAQQTLPGVPAAPVTLTATDARVDAANRLFAYWRVKCEHPAAKPTQDRARAIVARLREGYTEAEIRKAIDGAAVAAYVNEDTGQRYDDLTLVCRNGSKLESFIARGVKATGDIAFAVDDVHAPVEERIAAKRREMAELRRAGRQTEYDNAAKELTELMKGRQ